MRTAEAPFRAFGVDIGLHLAWPLNGNELGSPE